MGSAQIATLTQLLSSGCHGPYIRDVGRFAKGEDTMAA